MIQPYNFPRAPRSEASKRDPHVWRPVLDAASRVQRYYAARLEAYGAHTGEPSQNSAESHERQSATAQESAHA